MWQQLFADLQAQFEAEEEAHEWAESASRTRAELGAVGFADRLRGAFGLSLTLACGGAGTVSGVLVEVGADWLLVEDDGVGGAGGAGGPYKTGQVIRVVPPFTTANQPKITNGGSSVPAQPANFTYLYTSPSTGSATLTRQRPIPRSNGA